MRLRTTFVAIAVVLGATHSAFGQSTSISQQDAKSSTNNSPQSSSATSTMAATSSASNAQMSINASALITSVTSNSTSASASHIAASTSMISTASDETAQDRMPVNPRLTPAFGVAGVILVITGAATCFYGIRQKSIYTFFCSAFLTSLAATVLTIYLTKPPMSDAAQGGVLVAVVIAGCIVGSASIWFLRSIIEWPAGLLGGFCLSMWILTLKSDGLITSNFGRQLFIPLTSVVWMSACVYPRTRQYAVILTLAFTGATAMILGIDCFTLAGLKEFWVFLWDLNRSDTAPDTNKYLVTRPITAETATIPFLVLLGILAQIKIWQVVAEREARNNQARNRDEEERELLETRVGKEIEKFNKRERLLWEATYNAGGQQIHADSGLGSSIETAQKTTKTDEEHGSPDVQSRRCSTDPSLSTISPETTDADGSRTSDRLSQPSDVPAIGIVVDTTSDLSRPPSKQSLVGSQENGCYSCQSCKSSSNPPEVTPLPFTTSENSRIALQGAEARQDVESSAHLDRNNSSHTVEPCHDSIPLEEQAGMALEDMPHIEDELASSVAATADSDSDSDELYIRHHTHPVSPLFTEARNESLPASEAGSSVNTAICPVAEQVVEVVNVECTSIPGSTDDQDVFQDAQTGFEHDQGSTLDALANHENDGIVRTSRCGNLSDLATQRFSKVAMTYRTNEWAKHITDAEAPDAQEETGRHSQMTEVDKVFADEVAKPVDVNALLGRQEDISVGVPGHPTKSSSKMSLRPGNIGRASGDHSPKLRPTLALSTSQSSLDLTYRARNVAATSPLLGSSQASPVESQSETEPTSPGTVRNFSVPFTERASCLLDQRNIMLKKRATSGSFGVLASSSRLTLREPQRNGSYVPPEQAPQDDDDMTLAQRRDMIKRQRHASAPLTMSRQASNSRLSIHAGLATNRNSNEALIYDSHQPKSSATYNPSDEARRLEKWRAGLNAANATNQRKRNDDLAIEAVMNQHRRSQLRAQAQGTQSQEATASRQSMIDAAMRSGALNSAHRDAISRMNRQSLE